MPNTPPLLSRRKLLGFSIESVWGTEDAPSTPIAAVVYDATMTPQDLFSDGERAPQGHMGRVKRSTGPKAAQLTFRMELAEAGPFFDLVQACGMVKASGPIATPITAYSEQKTATFYLWEAGRVKKMYGAAGTFQIEAESGGRVFASFTFTGIWGGSDDVSYPSFTPSNSIGYRMAGITATFDGSDMPPIGSFTFTWGAQVEQRASPTTTTSIYHYAVVDRVPTLSLDPEARLVADHDAFGLLEAGTQTAVVLGMPGSSSGVEFKITAPKAQRLTVSDEDRGGSAIDAVEFELHADSGNDEVQIEE